MLHYRGRNTSRKTVAKAMPCSAVGFDRRGLHRLEQKGALRRVKKIGNAQIFGAAIDRSEFRGRLVRDLLELFGGSPRLLGSNLGRTMRAIRDEPSARGAGTANYNAPILKKFQPQLLAADDCFGWSVYERRAGVKRNCRCIGPAIKFEGNHRGEPVISRHSIRVSTSLRMASISMRAMCWPRSARCESSATTTRSLRRRKPTARSSPMRSPP